MDILGLLIFMSLLGSFIKLCIDSYKFTEKLYYYIKRIIQMEIKKRKGKQFKPYHPDFEIFYDAVIYLKDEEVYRKIKTLKSNSIDTCIKFINEKLYMEKNYIIDCVLNFILTSNENIPLEQYYFDILRPFMFCYELDFEYTEQKIKNNSLAILDKIKNENWKLNKDTRYELTIWLCHMIMLANSLGKDFLKYQEEIKNLTKENIILKNRLESDNYITKLKKYISRT
jgi:hypothetical protein